MKLLRHLPVTCIFIFFLCSSCKKYTTYPPTTKPGAARTVQYILYSTKDEPGNNKLITFRLSIQDARSKILWDSVLAPMKIKDIPALANKLVIEKTVPGNNNSLLKVGFYYAIENVGNSWHLESFEAGDSFKVVDFNFQ